MTSKKKAIVDTILKIFPFIFIQIVVLISLIWEDWNLIKYSAFLLAGISILISLIGLWLKKYKDDWFYILSSFSIYFTLWLFYFHDIYNLMSYNTGEIFSLINIFQIINLAILILLFLKKVDIKRIYQIVYVYYFIASLLYILGLWRNSATIPPPNIIERTIFLNSLTTMIFILIIAKTKRIISRISGLILFILFNYLFIYYEFLYINAFLETFVEYFKEYSIGLGVIWYIVLILIFEIIEKYKNSIKSK